MHAFIKTTTGLFKIYRIGDDWQILGPNFERWRSVWANDVLGSMRAAIEQIEQHVPGVVIDVVFMEEEWTS